MALHDTRDARREHATVRGPCPDDTRHDNARGLSNHGNRATGPGRRAARHTAKERVRTPSRRTSGDLESHERASFRRRMDGCRAEPERGPRSVIRGEDAPTWPPEQMHAPPARGR